MARPDSDQKLQRSVLDRLLDDRPKESQEAPASAAHYVSHVRAAVKRDLEWLLNSRQIVADLPSDLRQLRQSLLLYGLPDFTNSCLSNMGDQAVLQRTIEEAIRRFEPRLQNITVSLEPVREFERAIRFRIDALLNVDPEPEPVTFDSVLQLSTKAFVVQGE
jgi:type VI secretion system protein ImpF